MSSCLTHFLRVSNKPESWHTERWFWKVFDQWHKPEFQRSEGHYRGHQKFAFVKTQQTLIWCTALQTVLWYFRFCISMQILVCTYAYRAMADKHYCPHKLWHEL